MNEYNEAMANEYSYEYWLSRHDLHNDCSMSDCVECVKESETMNEQMVEVRVNYKRNIKEWETIEPSFVCPVAMLNECLIWQCACDALREIGEFRWNYVDSLQGHYVTPLQLVAIA